ncbi:MAG: hypothetical protein V4857_02830 [Pseudomonadota bacterium]
MNNAHRITLAILLAASAHSALANLCDTPANAKKTIATFEVNVEKVRAKQIAYEKEIIAEITAIKKQMVDSKRWTKKQSDAFYPAKDMSKDAIALEKRQLATVEKSFEANMKFGEHMSKGEVLKACAYTKSMLETLELAGLVSQSQFNYMLESTRKLAAK